ncbi:pre-toxin TG domain-containing protein [Hyalangium rubrum]|uniref:Pre-toxin TG domain-containing protein n=1 Tax=Hyalangium rubrum TaxID=3103134 RepID=A0ABU5H4K2_9BACT|nr:pre-toxin TG domain-containing protein [Hyalangium sp. s54d21]MDY7227743.1 pre-toxin TG domain-containing protein [Hyalangium sp. s54d21]
MNLPRMKLLSRSGARWLTVLLLGLSGMWGGCAAGPRPEAPCGLLGSCRELRAHARKMRTLRQRREMAERTEASTGGGAGAMGTGAVTPYLEFIREQEEQLKRARVPEEQQRLEHRVLLELQQWALSQDEATLRRHRPLEVYAELKAERQERERQEARRQAEVEAKLEEYLDWAQTRWGETARERVRRVAPGHLLTEHPLRTQSLDALTGAVLDWAFTHTRDEALLRKGPSEVALYLLARRSSLATAIELGRYAPPHLDYTPPEDTRPPADELVIELLAGLLPGIGEATDAAGLVAGYSITGRKLEPEERLLSGVAVLVPFVPGRALSGGGEWVERAALVTGRSLEEVRVLQRVASHLSPADASQVEVLVRQAAAGRRLSEEDVAFLRRVAAGLEKPLAEAADTLRRGGKVPLVGSRLGEAGLRLELGSAEHMAAAWVDYQFRHPDKYSRFRYGIDEDWRKKYETILKNKEKGSELEQAVLQARGQEKNRALMMPPPESEAKGFIPDAVVGSPTPGELVWGQPYHFVEVKARAKLSLSGNLEAMLRYVEKQGGHIEVWARSARHADGPTRLSAPLQDLLERLRVQGRASLRYYP